MIGGVKVAILDENENGVPTGTIGQVAIWRNNVRKMPRSLSSAKIGRPRGRRGELILA
jgi:hypothetical protein